MSVVGGGGTRGPGFQRPVPAGGRTDLETRTRRTWWRRLGHASVFVGFAIPPLVLGVLGIKKAHEDIPAQIDPKLPSGVVQVIDSPGFPTPSGEGLAIGGVIAAVLNLGLIVGRVATRRATRSENERLRSAVEPVGAFMTPAQAGLAESGGDVAVTLAVGAPRVRNLDVFVCVPNADGPPSYYRLLSAHVASGTHVAGSLDPSDSPDQCGFGASNKGHSKDRLPGPAVVGIGYSKGGHEVQEWFAGSGFAPQTIVDGCVVDTVGRAATHDTGL